MLKPKLSIDQLLHVFSSCSKTLLPYWSCQRYSSDRYFKFQQKYYIKNISTTLYPVSFMSLTTYLFRKKSRSCKSSVYQTLYKRDQACALMSVLSDM